MVTSRWDIVIERVGGTILFGLLGVLAVVSAIMSFQVFDMVFADTVLARGTLTSRQVRQETEVTTYITVGNTQVPQTQTIPTRWIATVEVEGSGPVTCPIREKQYQDKGNGETVTVEIGNGRFTDSPFCKRLL